MQLLVTGFEPFGGSAVNSSQEVVRALDSQIDELAAVVLHTCILPVEAKDGPATLLKAIGAIDPDAVLCLGESSRARAITLERVFVNLADYRIADNAGVRLLNQPIAPRGPAAYFSTLPLEAMARAVRDADIPLEESLSAGAFLCNHVAYVLLRELERRRRRARRRKIIPAGFVHLPRLPEQMVGDAGKPSMPLAIMVRSVRLMIRALHETHAAGKR